MGENNKENSTVQFYCEGYDRNGRNWYGLGNKNSAELYGLTCDPTSDKMKAFFNSLWNWADSNPIYNRIYGKKFTVAIKKVIFSDPATIIMWEDGTKTVVKAQNEPYDPEKGIAMCYVKKLLGNKGNYYNKIKEWLPDVGVPDKSTEDPDFKNAKYISDIYNDLTKVYNDPNSTKQDCIETIESCIGLIGEILN